MKASWFKPCDDDVTKGAPVMYIPGSIQHVNPPRRYDFTLLNGDTILLCLTPYDFTLSNAIRFYSGSQQTILLVSNSSRGDRPESCPVTRINTLRNNRHCTVLGNMSVQTSDRFDILNECILNSCLTACFSCAFSPFVLMRVPPLA